MTEIFQQKTDVELEAISKDYVFYSDEERLGALNELEKRIPLSDELIELKIAMEGSDRIVPPLGNEKPTEKIYSENEIWVGTMIGGPLAAGYYIAENFKIFLEPNKAKKTWIYALTASLMIFCGIFLIPTSIDIPNQLIPLIYTGITWFLVQHFQHRTISEHTVSGGTFHSWGRTICISFIGAAISLVLIFGIALSVTNTSMSTKTYGFMKHEIGFDKRNITETEVDKLAEGLTKITFFDGVQTKNIYAEKKRGDYELSIPVIDGIVENDQALQLFIDLRNELQMFFPDNKIVLKLVVDHLDHVIKRIE